MIEVGTMVLFLIAFSAVLFFLFDQPLAATLVLCGAFWLSGWYFIVVVVLDLFIEGADDE